MNESILQRDRVRDIFMTTVKYEKYVGKLSECSIAPVKKKNVPN